MFFDLCTNVTSFYCLLSPDVTYFLLTLCTGVTYFIWDCVLVGP